MKRFLIAIVAIGHALSAMCADVWSLDSCISYAVSHNLDVRSAEIETASTALDLTEAKDRFLPTVSAGASQSWDFGRGLTAQNTYANRNTSSFGWSARLSLPLFQGLSALRELRRARAAQPVSQARLRDTREQTALGVLSYYFQALYTRSMTDVARENLTLAREQLSRTRLLVEGGKTAEVEVLQAEAEVARNEAELVQAEGDAELALLDLRQALNLDPAIGFDIAPVETAGDGAVIPQVADIYASALGTNSGLRAAEGDVELARHAISIARTGYIPQLSLSAGLGSSYYTLSGADNQPFGRQMRENFSKSIGLTLSVPVFDAFATRNRVRRAQVQLRQADLALERSRTNLYKAIEQAHRQAVTAGATLASSEAATEAARVALDAMQKKYDFGRATLTETTEARTTYVNALARLTQARYEQQLRRRILDFYADPSTIL